MNKVAPANTEGVPVDMNSHTIIPQKGEPPGVVIDTETLNLNGKRVPKRVLHFSDGVLEEYSSDEDDVDDSPNETQISTVNASNLPWGPWFVLQATYVGAKALSACDYVGETLATFFGLTSPKYEYEIEEYKRIKAEEEDKKKQTEVELAGWTSTSTNIVELQQIKSNKLNDLNNKINDSLNHVNNH